MADEDIGNDANNQPKKPIKQHKVYKNMMKRFLSRKDWEEEEYGPWIYGRHRHKKVEDSFEDGDQSNKEVEGYYPQEDDYDGIDKSGKFYVDRDYAGPLQHYDYSAYNR